MTSSALYVHIPFCATRCGYCDFNAYADLDHLRSSYARAILTEARLWSDPWADLEVTTVFLGGGTPTRLDPDDIVSIFEGLRSSFDIAANAEITVEANPETLDAETIAALVSSGVNRVSMGAQSFDPGVLSFLERSHDPASVGRAVAALRAAGIGAINLDLIYGTPGETPSSWDASLAAALELAPDHVSAYALTVEPMTPLGRQVAAGSKPSPDADIQADRYDVACGTLAEAGYSHYEISNWAKPHEECQHNLWYWRRAPYLGLGCGAHSYRDDRRWWNVRPPGEYLDLVADGKVPIGGEEILDEEDIQLEKLLLGLRTSDGIVRDDVSAEVALDTFIDGGLLESRGGRLRATDRGMFVANDLAIELSGSPRLGDRMSSTLGQRVLKV